jgi:hypothetical protein
MKPNFTLYIAMIFILMTIVSVYCRDKKQKEVTGITIENGLSTIVDTIRFFDLVICDSLGDHVATKENGKWTITNCEKALEEMLKSHHDLIEMYDKLLKKLYKDEEKETPLDVVFANNKN